MNPIWRGVVVQLWMSTCMLIVTMTALLIHTEAGIVQILCGAMATAYGAMMMRAKIDGGQDAGGGGYGPGQSMRAPRIVVPDNAPQIRTAQTRIALLTGLAMLLSVLLLAR